MKFRPFASYLPLKEKAADIVCPPYDVVDTQEARSLAGPDSFLHIIRSEIELSVDIDVHSSQVYDLAANNLNQWISKGLLFKDSEPCLYLYRLTAFGRSQTGIAGLSFIDDYLNNKIKKHEFTRPDKEEDRRRHIDRTGCNTEPVFFAYRSEAVPRIEEILQSETNRPADYDVVTEDKVRHEIFRIPVGKVQDELVSLYQNLDSVYIADGHHRTASTVRVGVSRRDQAKLQNKPITENDEYQWFLSVTFPSSHLFIMPYNRLVKDLNGYSVDEFLLKLKQIGSVAKRQTTTTELHRIDFYLEKEWYSFRPNIIESDVSKSLDVAILQDQVLAPVLGIHDARTSERISFVGGIRGEKELIAKVDSGDWSVAFSLHATPIQSLFDIADSGNVMPPKSTWFEPKLRSGFFVHSLNQD